MSTADAPPIQRIRSLNIQDFRGFAGTHALDTDADLVLITGPNGYGKSSLMEAITLLLTGWSWPYGQKQEVPPADLTSRNSEDTSGFVLSARVEGRLEEDSLRCIEHIELRPDDGALPLPTWIRANGGRDDSPGRFRLIANQDRYADRELPARLTAFFQDRIDKLFDETVTGKTLRDIYEPLPPGIVALLEDGEPDSSAPVKTLSDARNALEKAKKGLNQPPPEGPEAGFDSELENAYVGLRPIYLDLAVQASGWPDAAGTPAVVTDDIALDAWARQVLNLSGSAKATDYGELREYLRKALEREIQRQIEVAKENALGDSAEGEKLKRELDQVNAKIEAITDRYSNLREDVRMFAPSEPGQPDAPLVFRTLADNAARWSRVAVSAGVGDGAEVKRFQRALDELAAVVPVQASQCAQAIDDWLAPRLDDFDRLKKLLEEKKRLKEARKRARASAELDELRARQKALNGALRVMNEAWEQRHRLREWQEMSPHRTQAIKLVEAAQQAIDWYREQILSTARPGPNCELMCDVQRLANGVLRRFSLVDGILPLRLVPQQIPTATASDANADQTRRIYEIHTADRRTLGQLSTGQRAQVAVSFLASQNLAVHQYLSHGVLVLDDVTTAYDLSNLTREAVLWRQLAYGDVPDSHRRQVFISSHHEDMTNHMLDLLVPPEGKRMRLIRFTGWTLQSGPAYELFDITPTSAAGTAYEPGKGRTALSRDLSAF